MRILLLLTLAILAGCGGGGDATGPVAKCDVVTLSKTGGGEASCPKEVV